jgi:hypothetical protein
LGYGVKKAKADVPGIAGSRMVRIGDKMESSARSQSAMFVPFAGRLVANPAMRALRSAEPTAGHAMPHQLFGAVLPGVGVRAGAIFVAFTLA